MLFMSQIMLDYTKNAKNNLTISRSRINNWYISIKDRKENISIFTIIGTLLLFSLTRYTVEWYHSSQNTDILSKVLIPSVITLGYNIIILIIPALFFNSKQKLVMNFAIFFVFAFSNFLDFIHLFQYNTPISMGAFAVIFETTPQEATEFFELLQLKDIILCIFLAFYPVIIFNLLYSSNIPSKKIFAFATIIFLISTTLAGIHGFVMYNKASITHHSFTHSNIYNDVKRILYYIREKQKLKDIHQIRNGISVSAKQVTKLDSLKQTHVLIIGESMSKYHLSLYGYHRNTSPTLDTLANLNVFDNVITPATQTRTALMMLLTRASVNDLDSYYTSESIINLANAAGFHTSWISNQMMYGISDTETTVMAKDADYIKYVNVDWNTNSLDEKILPEYYNIINSVNKKKFIIIHLLGSHFDYKKRYPDNEKYYFHPLKEYPSHIDPSQINIINDYDKSIRYTDYVIGEIIKPLINRNELSSVVYLSDHGEEVYDRPGIGLGHGSPNVSKEVADIPFLIWNNKSYITNRQICLDHKDKMYSAENLIHTMVDIMGIETIFYDNRSSIINRNYKEQKVTILNSNNKILRYDDQVY